MQRAEQLDTHHFCATRQHQPSGLSVRPDQSPRFLSLRWLLTGSNLAVGRDWGRGSSCARLAASQGSTSVARERRGAPSRDTQERVSGAQVGTCFSYTSELSRPHSATPRCPRGTRHIFKGLGWGNNMVLHELEDIYSFM
ncbi:hypothetical protein GN956_G12226 [Arapaima gigas]